MQVFFTRRAETQIAQLHDYIADRAGEQRAGSYIARIVRFCQTLTMFPQRGVRRDDLLPGLRIVGFERRVTIAFTISDDKVLVEGIFYAGRNLSSAWRAK